MCQSQGRRIPLNLKKLVLYKETKEMKVCPRVKSWLVGEDSGAGRDWQEKKGTTEDGMAGWHHRLDGREFG